MTPPTKKSLQKIVFLLSNEFAIRSQNVFLFVRGKNPPHTPPRVADGLFVGFWVTGFGERSLLQAQGESLRLLDSENLPDFSFGFH